MTTKDTSPESEHDEKQRVRREAEIAQARILQRQRAEQRNADSEAAPRPFRRAGDALKRILDDAARRSGFRIDWEKHEVIDGDK